MQLFPRTLNMLPLVLGVVAGGGGAVTTAAGWYYLSPKFLVQGYAPEQPVQYSHRLHAGELGIDCRYCHANVERSAEAMIPATQTCMGCHATVRTESPRLSLVRESFQNNTPIPWVRVHQVPDHAFFDHSVHLAVGVGCSSCHGRVDQMEVVRVAQPISMGWCLECHRDPGPNLRPRSELTNMAWTQTATPELQAELASAVHPPENCSGCHR